MDNTNRFIYDSNYSDANLMLVQPTTSPYLRELIEMRLEYLRRYGTGKRVLDLCCGTGAYLLYAPELYSSVIGVDFSLNLLRSLQEQIGARDLANTGAVLSDARHIALQSETMDLIFSYTSLYHVPNVLSAILETARVLSHGGIAILELGNQHSLNTLVSNAAHRKNHTARPYHISYLQMKAYLAEAGFTILEHRVFQILPMWNQGARWLIPLTHPIWGKILAKKIGKRMLDEWLSSLWPLRFLAFRHFFICQKP